jgi:DNA polymerase I-like protein with 3'-5' exonuclease and polymerase domains
MAKEIKNLFQAEAPSKKYPEGTALIQLDYKTAEVRWAAIFAKDQNLIRVFNEARDALLAACDPSSNLSDEEFEATQLASDIHRRTASLMYGVPPDKVSKEMRQASKGITFGLLFGMGIETLASSNNWSVEEAEKKVEMFFSAFPQLRAWLDANPKRAEKQKYVETLMGRRRRLGFLYMNNSFKDKAKASRLSKNAPIQGQSSDAGILGLVSFLQYLIDNNLERKWLIQNVVHDSCLVQVPMQDLEPALKAMQYHFVDGMKKYLEKYFKFTIPLPIECEIEVGLKYGALTKWDGRPSTLGKLIEKLKEDAKKLWSEDGKKGNKPPKECDLLKFKGK